MKRFTVWWREGHTDHYGMREVDRGGCRSKEEEDDTDLETIPHNSEESAQFIHQQVPPHNLSTLHPTT